MNIIQDIKENKGNMLLGLLSGLVNGLLGSGGGIIYVAGSTMLMHSRQKQAQASAIPAMLMFSIISTVMYIIKGVSIDVKILVPVALGSVAGGVIGAKLLNKFSNKVLKNIFAAMIIFSGVRMLCS